MLFGVASFGLWVAGLTTAGVALAVLEVGTLVALVAVGLPPGTHVTGDDADQAR